MGNFVDVEFLYTIDPNAEEPIMLLDDEIGYDEVTGKGISGQRFSRELLFLDTLNKSRINIWINSPGGSISDAEQIVSTMLKIKTKVDTHNVGMAASAAGPVFLAGCKRFMMEHARFMMHPVSGTTDPKAYEAYTNTTVKMLSSRVDLTEDTIRRMMNETTWLDADACERLGFCKKETNASFNKPRKEFDPNNVAESHKDFKAIVNNAIQKHKVIPMKKVTNKLNLNEAASEDAILAEIEKIENHAKSVESKLTAQEAENSAKVTALNAEISSLTEAKNKAESELTQIKNKEAEEKAAKLKAEAKALVENGVKEGKIENKAEVIEKFTNLAEKDIEATKAVLEAIPASKKSPGNILNKTEGAEVPKYTAAGIMAQIAIKNKQTRI